MNKPAAIRCVSVGVFLAILGGCAGNGPTPPLGTVDACDYAGLAMISKLSGMSDHLPFPALEGVNERRGDCRAAPPLLFAAAGLDDGQLPAIRHLMTQGADVKLTVEGEGPIGDDPRYLGATALHLAAWGSNRVSVLDLLIGFGAEVAARTASDATPLHFAAAAGDPDMVELLLERGADANALDERGWTTLHYAADASEHEDVVTTLVDIGGADLEATTRSGQTASDLILENQALKDTEAAYLLEIR